MNRPDCLDKAKEIVTGQREKEYNSPEDSFKAIAALWSAYKGADFTATDVAMMMSLLKIARIRTGTATEDSFVDLAGYAACGCEIATEKLGEGSKVLGGAMNTWRAFTYYGFNIVPSRPILSCEWSEIAAGIESWAIEHYPPKLGEKIPVPSLGIDVELT